MKRKVDNAYVRDPDGELVQITYDDENIPEFFTKWLTELKKAQAAMEQPEPKPTDPTDEGD